MLSAFRGREISNGNRRYTNKHTKEWREKTVAIKSKKDRKGKDQN
jgi:hypothetical protein